jgi:hypothetical protein
MEDQEKPLKCLDGYWDQPICVFFQHVKQILKAGIITELNFDFIKQFIGDLVKCGFIQYESIVSLTKWIELEDV